MRVKLSLATLLLALAAFASAQVAQDAKKTAELIPLCHPIALTSVAIDFEPDHAGSCVHIRASVKTIDSTGVEMEALTAVQIGLLTVYDMCKAVDRGMEIGHVRLLEKHLTYDRRAVGPDHAASAEGEGEGLAAVAREEERVRPALPADDAHHAAVGDGAGVRDPLVELGADAAHRDDLGGQPRVQAGPGPDQGRSDQAGPAGSRPHRQYDPADG